MESSSTDSTTGTLLLEGIRSSVFFWELQGFSSKHRNTVNDRQQQITGASGKKEPQRANTFVANKSFGLDTFIHPEQRNEKLNILSPTWYFFFLWTSFLKMLEFFFGFAFTSHTLSVDGD